MPVTSGFYNSLHGDRRYDAMQISSMFDGVLTDGVYQGYGSKFAVVATTGRVIQVGTGRAWFDHTWTLNDSVLAITLDPEHATLNRYDEVVIEVNSSDDVRANTIKVVKGVEAATPSRPGLTNTSTIKQYSLAYVYRPANTPTVLTSHITSVVGTPSTPYVANLVNGNLSLYSLFDAIGNPKMHRTVFRGKNLGTSFTGAQKAAIVAGTFDDLWLGDYWVIGGVTWRIADINYWYKTGDVQFLQNHIVVIPDSSLYTTKMNTTASTASGYAGSNMRTTNLNAAKTTVNSAFPGSVLTHREILSTQVISNYVENYAWYDSTVEIPTEQMFFGTSFYSDDERMNSGKQLALMSVDPTFSHNPGNVITWFRNVHDGSHYTGFNNDGTVDFFVTNDVIGVRPVFAIG